MKTRLALLCAIAFGSVLAFAPGSARARPPSPTVTTFQLNGEFTRPLGEDAGINGVRGLLLQGGSNVASVPITKGAIYRIDCMSDGGAANVCTASTDGGCTADPTDINWGIPVAAGGFVYVITQDTGLARIYATANTAVGFTCPVSLMK